MQTTVGDDVLRKFDTLARAQGHRRASYLRHLVEMHVQALTPSLAKITKSTSLLDNLEHMDLSDDCIDSIGRLRARRPKRPRDLQK